MVVGTRYHRFSDVGDGVHPRAAAAHPRCTWNQSCRHEQVARGQPSKPKARTWSSAGPGPSPPDTCLAATGRNQPTFAARVKTDRASALPAVHGASCLPVSSITHPPVSPLCAPARATALPS